MAVNAKSKDRILASIEIGFLCSIAILCLGITVTSHLTNFYFLPAHQRFIIIALLLLAVLIVFYLLFFNLKKRTWHFQIRISGKQIILSLAILLISGIIVASSVIPPARIPVMHTLEIQVLPAEGETASSISVLKINRAIRAPRPGGAEADLQDVTVSGGYQQDSDGIRLEEGATLIYSAFYSGCITVHFGTSPEAGQVLVRFDAIEEKFSLSSMEPSSTIVDLCSPLPWRDLSFKWQAILLLIYFADLVSILTLTGMGIAVLYYLGFNQNLRLDRKSVV